MRPIYHVTDSPPRETTMGKVLTSLTVINRADQIRAKDGTIAPEKVRSVDLVDVLGESFAGGDSVGDARIGTGFTEPNAAGVAVGNGEYLFDDFVISTASASGSFG